jgi:type VI secretion system protein ImpH
MNEAELLLHALQETPWAHDFHHALRRLEALHPERPRWGLARRPKDDALRLGQQPALDFAPASVAGLTSADDKRPARLEIRFFGLLGPNGPLPLHLTEHARERLLHHGDASFARFLDVFHHRLLSLFQRAWAQPRPTVSFDRPEEDRFHDYVGSLIGIATPECRERDAAGDRIKLAMAGWLARPTRNAEGLRALLVAYFRLPVEIEEFVGHWMSLPDDDLTRLGRHAACAQLGVGAVAGRRVWDRQHKIRVRLGPLTLAQYEDFLPKGSAHGKIVALLRQYLSLELDWDARLALKADEVPRVQLGGSTWLGQRPQQTPADELVLNMERLAA